MCYLHTEARPCNEFTEFPRKKDIRIDFEFIWKPSFCIFEKSFLEEAQDQTSPSLKNGDINKCSPG